MPDRSYGLSLTTRGEKNFIFLERMHPGPPVKSEILEVLEVSKLSAGEIISIQGGCCEQGKKNGYIIAIYKPIENVEVIKRIRKAWLIDLKSKRFVPLDPKTITCFNEGYGI